MLFQYDIKPVSYSHLTFMIISSISGFNEGKARFLSRLEKILIDGLTGYIPPDEKIDMDRVRVFEGKNLSRVLAVWYSHMAPQVVSASLLLKLNRFRLN